MPVDSTPNDHASTTRAHDPIRDPETIPQLPERLGRYVIRDTLGTGGFAEVFLAHDEELDREVALKVPRADKFTDAEALQQVADEARLAAGLQHPGIVPVFDVGTYEGIPYIVLQYVRGRSLDHLLQHDPPSYAGAAQLTAEVAVALAHAHDRGFVHRDIKPRNILLDMDDCPHVADFGLAVRHRETSGSRDDVAGTTRYMAPEQVRGENHRIDARTDIWGLGVVFYQLLTGRLPFSGSSSTEIFQKIVYGSPVPPRQIDPQIPEELERICLRCLCRQMSERYRKATDLADDLFDWLRFTTGDSGGSSVSGGSSFRRRLHRIEAPDAPIIPRGLRSFGREDVDFFLRLVPGPRDRDGLPVSLRFWKHRIEEREPDETFRVGLLYGPSGCGKSSLVKAGLLPRLHSDVACVYVETTSQDTESKLLRLLRRKFRGLPEDVDLPAALRQLREEAELRDRKKVLIVLDQFEQCLHASTAGPSGELLRGLLQCDGGNVQCLLMVRDDFWLPVSRFMSELEIGIVDGENAMLVDSFDPDHARSVLREFGVAYGRLPEKAADQTEQQTGFLEQAMRELAEEGRLYPVRLAVFVEMVRDRDWVPATLAEMGGVEGVGVAFLENSVGALASPARRVHEQAARSVLSLLLPPAGQIKGPVRTCSEVRDASGYARRPRAFEELMHLLDVELRLLTPAGASAEDSSRAGDSESSQSRQEMTYQLTHDFLVPSIREWLERQMRSDRGGRLRLLLQDQAELWNGRPSARYLPSLVEWAGIRLFTNRRKWTGPQRRMMQAVERRLARRAGLVVGLLLLGALIGWVLYRQNLQHEREQHAVVLCSMLQDVEMEDVRDIIAEMADYREWTDPTLQDVVSDSSQSERRRIRAAMALLPVDHSHVEWLTERLVSEELQPDAFAVVQRALLQADENRVAGLLRTKLDARSTPQRQRFRIACALAGFDDSSAVWQQIAPEIASSLIRQPTPNASVWIESLRPVSNELREPLIAEFGGSRTLESARIGALALFDFDDGQVDGLIGLLMDAEGPQYRAIVELLRGSENSLAALHNQVSQIRQDAPEYVGDPGLYAKRLANLVLAIFELGDQSLLRQESTRMPDPRIRTRLIHGMNPERMDLDALLPLILEPHDDPFLRNVAMASVWRHRNEPLSLNRRDRLSNYFEETYQSAPDRETHAIAGLLLKSLGVNVAEPDEPRLRDNMDNESCQWATNDAGQTMIVLDPARDMPTRSRAPDGLDYRFAISAHEVTFELFREYAGDHAQNEILQVDADDVPATGVLMIEIAGFCNWLSQRDGIDPSQWCYPPLSELNVANCDPVPDYLTKSGYRIPTTLEWEFACQAGSESSRFYGDDPELMQFYAWDRIRAGQILQRVGQLLPNAYGLFDIYGNAAELCIAPPGPDQPSIYYACGESCMVPAARMTSASAQIVDHRSRSQYQGFRVAITLPE